MLNFIKNIGLLEISLIQIIFYSSMWFIDDYFAILISVILTTILFATLIISLITELIEKSRVPRSYFTWMIVSTIIPLVVAAFFVLVLGVKAL
ncbi:MAG: hypothetical protein ACI86M_003179 [Saprospiraceae bacterium]|jgi:hypothetical protein